MQLDGETVTPIHISSRKGCGLIAHLAMHAPQGESRENLATLLWGNNADRQARQNLRQCLATLRSDLAMSAPGLLTFEGDTIGLDIAALDVDAREFAALADSIAIDDLVHAAGLYRGEFLEGFGFEVEPFDEWLRAERARIVAAAAKVFEACAAHFDGLRQGGRVIDAAERLAALDPLREDWQRRLLRAYARYRGIDTALAHGTALSGLLKRELGVEPDSATRALLDEIRRGSIAPASSAPGAAGGKATAINEPAGVAERQPGQTLDMPSAPSRLTRFLPEMSRASVAIAALCAIFVLAGTAIFVSRMATTTIQGSSSWAPPQPPAGLAGTMATLRTNAIVPILIWPLSAPDGGEDRKLADAMTDDLITNMSRNDGLRVISRQTTYYYRGRTADAAAIGAELGVSYVVEGSVRTQGTRCHVNIQLVDTNTRLQVWADQFERDDFDRFDVQNEIIRRLARELRVEAITSDLHYNRKEPEAPVRVLIAKGRAAQFRGANKEALAEALNYFDLALEREPRLVPGLVGAAAALTMGSLNYVLDPKPSLKRAQDLMQRAMQIDPDSASTNYWMGMVEKALSHFNSALQLFQHAIEIDPSFAPAYAQAGMTMTLMGHPNEGLGFIQYAMRLSPKDRTMHFWTTFAGATELERSNDKAALEWLGTSAAYTPDNPAVHMFLASAYALEGDHAAASRQVADFLQHANKAAVADMMSQIRLGTRGDYSNLRRLRTGLELAFSLH